MEPPSATQQLPSSAVNPNAAPRATDAAPDKVSQVNAAVAGIQAGSIVSSAVGVAACIFFTL
jgi:hypothetical protein